VPVDEGYKKKKEKARNDIECSRVIAGMVEDHLQGKRISCR
jgi:hypothetical protein